MSDLVKIVIVLSATAIVIAAMLIYFSPYHSCVRGGERAVYCVNR